MPDPHQRQQHRQVFGPWRGFKMAIHIVAALQEGVEILGPDGQHDRKANRPPHGIAPADPIGKTEHVIRVDSEGAGLVGGRAERGELTPHIAAARLKPGLCGMRVGHRLDGGEGLGGDNHQRGARVQILERIGNMRAIHVRHEMAARPVMVWRQRQHRHHRPQIRSANADIDHIGDLAAGACDFTTAQSGGEIAHPLQCRAHLGHDILPVHDHRRRILPPQGRVQNRPVFGLVDFLTGEHGRAPLRYATCVTQTLQRLQDFSVQMGLGKVEMQIAQTGREPRRAVRVGGEQIRDTTRRRSAAQRFQSVKHDTDTFHNQSRSVRAPNVHSFRSEPRPRALRCGAMCAPGRELRVCRRQRSQDACSAHRLAPARSG